MEGPGTREEHSSSVEMQMRMRSIVEEIRAKGFHTFLLILKGSGVCKKRLRQEVMPLFFVSILFYEIPLTLKIFPSCGDFLRSAIYWKKVFLLIKMRLRKIKI